jgi:hypothetical protein
MPFAEVIPLQLDPSEAGRGLSLSEFVAADIAAVLPGLVDDSELQSFIEVVLSRVLKMPCDNPRYRLQLIQLESLYLGKCVVEEIADIWCQLVGRAMGATFWDGGPLPVCPYSDRLAMHLARGTDNDNAKTLVFPCHVTHVVLADPPPLYLDPSAEGAISKFQHAAHLPTLSSQ